ncbi:response regulator receiver protein [Clostridium pasteurianum DSM 525 = ATCC 6013]|uniref:Stage 0 sporulation protein A homolog n=1 Tax=Clostridium pasteurianum DSM 525 = ATCC 6013 TaxID=1262449 RepID=A0A0H3JAD8_CLOPA|nr:response regulator [Clostridium pasteurianum]AJA48475.1 response regulator receiver protein [Clostridium pasteurianum DSM 525 = ATCC 6013]AJA52463.1 response regulator receiver protein [Clostridium pasteurianum DSM 525 = ATCC 6013]AOZ75717.1 hypothetical protein AQ983_11695 [Clostridium pasteurianum DSM 525 = ATCC 6013]AOZ79513.1 hypothetical protein AQ984_11690 [Clostridium pasteurianum]ELP60377.1 response regulator receiver protein [Clostridium pasteurianum DSM 525 = ATCC 6013]
MKILIVEDDKLKIEQLANIITNTFHIEYLEKKYSFQSGMKEIKQNKYDLIILDMSMPTFDISPKNNCGPIMSFAGKEIMRQMKRKNIEAPVIVVTQYDTLGEKAIKLSQLNNELELKFGDFYLGVVYYDITLENWKEDIVRVIKKVLK